MICILSNICVYVCVCIIYMFVNSKSIPYIHYYLLIPDSEKK